jgi:hypothetical protein
MVGGCKVAELSNPGKDNGAESPVLGAEATLRFGEGSDLIYVVTLDRASTEDVHFKWTTELVSASDADYSLSPADKPRHEWNEATIPAGETSLTINMTTDTDNLHEGDETFKIKIADVTGASTLEPELETLVTISDDHPLMSVNVSGT